MDTQPNQSSPNNQTKGFLNQTEEFFNTYLHKKAPFHLPPHVKEWIVKFGPWITLILMLIALPVILVALGVSAVVAPAAMMYGGSRGGFMVSGVFSLVAFALEAAALPGLFKRSIGGWRLVYYSCLVSAIGELLSFNIIGMIIGLVISMYFLFEIKEYYK